MPLKLTQDELRRYAPYYTMLGFAEGFADYIAGRKLQEHPGAFGQAYDRGAECDAAAERQKPHRHAQFPLSGQDILLFPGGWRDRKAGHHTLSRFQAPDTHRRWTGARPRDPDL
jgi:hypothetical protein